jgi:hypothetical protein
VIVEKMGTASLSADLTRTVSSDDSEPGRGTFRLYLPRGDETGLIVEDNVQLRRAAVRQLTASGNTTADNLAVALRVLAVEDHVDRLFIDVVMPREMDGIDDLTGQATRLPSTLRVWGR